MSLRWLIVGAGFTGAVIAERIANVLGEPVVLVDRRSHIGGNAYDCHDEHGVLIHKYGPHIFHTNAARVVAYLSQFTEWHPYSHRVLAQVDGKLLPMPISRATVNELYGLDLRDDEACAAYFASVAEPVKASILVNSPSISLIARPRRDCGVFHSMR